MNTGLAVVNAPGALRVLPRDRAGDVWRAVEAGAGPDTPPFCGWDWTRLWLEHYGDAVPHDLLVFERGGEPCGVVLLTRSVVPRGPFRVRRLHVGTAGESTSESPYVQYNGLCTSLGERAALASAVLRHAKRVGGWDELHLDGFDPVHAQPFLDAESHFVIERRGSRLLELDLPGEDLCAVLDSKNTRKAVRRSLRGLSPYTTEWAVDLERAHLILDDLERLHQLRWESRGRPGLYASKRFRSFHRQLVTMWLPDGKAVVFAVRQGQQTVAALYGFVVGDTLQAYQSGIQVFEHNKVRCGYAADYLWASAARERGLRGFEFLTGDQRYKDELSTTERQLVWAKVLRRRPRALLMEGLSAARRRVIAWRGVPAQETPDAG